MKDVLEQLEAWRQQDEDIAVATVIETWGSAPRQVGAKMTTTRSGGLAGSVSGGCVEGAVIEESKAVMQSGEPRLLTFGVADETAWEVGLACGGNIRVLVEPFSAWDSIYASLKRRIEARDAMAVVSALEGPPEQSGHKLIVLPDGSTEGQLAIDAPVEQVVKGALALLDSGKGGILELEDGPSLFVEVYPPVPRLIMVGAVDIANSLVPLARQLGFDTLIVDPRGAFATRERFPEATELIKEWPQKALPEMALDGSAYVAVLTHDPKLDDPALQVALRSEACYVGALGSKRTAEKRARRLREAGLTDEELARLHAPIGLPLGGRSPAEIAMSIMAEILQAKNSVAARETTAASA
jgi:xanthine dehydrogenase accessory factor